LGQLRKQQYLIIPRFCVALSVQTRMWEATARYGSSAGVAVPFLSC